MAKIVLNVFKRIGKAYIDSIVLYYRPMIDAKVNPWL